MKVIGHRGFKAEFPENSLYGFQKAIESGIRAFELDVHLTRDNRVVVTHDPEITNRLFRTRTGDRIQRSHTVSRMTYDYLQTYDYGSHRNKKSGYPRTQVPGETLPLLKEVLALDKAEEIEWCIEIKFGSRLYPDADQIVSCVLQVIEEMQVTERTIVFSFSREILATVRRRNPALAINFLYEGGNLIKPLSKYLNWYVSIPNWPYCHQIVKELRADYFSPHYRLLEVFPGWRSYFSRDKRHCGLLTWTCNRLESWQKFYEDGELDGIVTDEPVLLSNLIDSLED